MKFMQATLDLYNFRKALRQSKVCKCETPLYRNSADLWHALLCPREEGSKVYPRQCVANNCSDCCGAARLFEDVLCDCIGDHKSTRIEWKMYEKVDTHKKKSHERMAMSPKYTDGISRLKQNILTLMVHRLKPSWNTLPMICGPSL